MNLQDVCKLAWVHIKKKRESGQIPSFLGIDGMLALMYDNITRFRAGEQPDYDEVLKLAANAIVALELVCKETLTDTPPEEEEDQHTPTLPPPKQQSELLPQPPEFDGWNYDPVKACGLFAWLVETGQWELLTPEQQIGIEEAAQVEVSDAEESDEVFDEEESAGELEGEGDEVSLGEPMPGVPEPGD